MISRIIQRLRQYFQSEPGYWWAIDGCWEEINIHGTVNDFVSTFERFPSHTQNILAAHCVVSEVTNGAIPQLFLNGSGILAPEAVVALKEIGFEESAGALDAAISEIGLPYPRDRDDRIRIVGPLYSKNRSSLEEALLDRLLELTDAFLDGLGESCRDFEPRMMVYADRYRAGA